MSEAKSVSYEMIASESEDGSLLQVKAAIYQNAVREEVNKTTTTPFQTAPDLIAEVYSLKIQMPHKRMGIWL